ncbi:MAG: toll/interleukin-1 receptor domain-containing protein [Nostoc sp. ChiQUE02]|uniref:toll/interleukin-1 receptor domain-containing protein n=1 Tax=Nostoc sp. ChiQUE02 TaxID=3075377 RepID=UPI002AD4EBC2|nr:tetratricopeptide repeat protein [Nostoc sp. ChiQUE02]MDZ8231445.1 tetratricopeptide repeat protein [Nostoc sp. ChiQUE02]
MKSIEVFISYHQKDEELREELEMHLATLLREKLITSWHKREIIAGQEFQDEINKYLKRAGLILLLVSPDFIASDYHWTIEVTRALEQNAAGKARVIPVLLRYADWDNPPIDKLSPLPRNRKPIKSWSDRDEAFLEVVKGIREAAQLAANSNSSTAKQNAPELEDRQYQVTSLINKANRLYENKKLEEAVIKYKAALGLDPNSVFAHNNLGITLYDQGKLEEAIAAYCQALRLNPNFVIAHNNLGNALKAQGKLEEAIASYRQALHLDLNYAIAHYNLGNALKDQGKLEQAIASYNQTLHLDPNFTMAYHNLAGTLYAQGKRKKAITAYRQALHLDPNFVAAHYNLGIVLEAQGKLEQAIISYKQALHLDPNFAMAYNNLGGTLYAQGKRKKAIAELEIAVRLDPSNTMIRENLESLKNKNKSF